MTSAPIAKNYIIGTDVTNKTGKGLYRECGTQSK